MKLSILDQSPISSNQKAQHALIESMKLAQLGDVLGYTRYWIAEHHDLPGLACSAPEVMLGYIGAQTNRIRIGAGAVLLPHYKPYKVAEVYNMLETLFPNRIDIGIGRSPGGSAEATNALNDNFLQKVYQMPELVEELLHFFHQDFPSDHQFSKISASPIPETTPQPWMLGTSEKSAILAAQNGLAYAFGQFMSEQDGTSIIESYRKSFQPKIQNQPPQVLVTVPVICAETKEKAEEIALSTLIWQLFIDKGKTQTIPSIEVAKKYKLSEKENEQLSHLKKKMIIGNPKEVQEALHQLQAKYKVDEFMILTITHSPEERANSYKLIAQEVLS
ncbi:LLM class flavin-dependent oxidoreductase [Ureibacillus sp. 179-F W5.1 NHS]|uniref:LLM class flavin-dependent oxidoreductase n=1 Tax=Lysinibacillus halotolerans TaxID=1368476 RepID=A0A3M8HGZ3_9BACI|nr:LLM class flavin-dependent oxidoreductase [Lysinibacillus halotolerans]RND01351.1 LLM class flavin-dependent oxidoreductase [Lysinibacillus halotolerans]